MNKEKYLKAPVRCPYCNTDNIDGSTITETHDITISEALVTCRDCGESWTEVWKLIEVKE